MTDHSGQRQRTFVIVGNAPAGMGHPHARTTVDMLRNSTELDVHDFCHWEMGQQDFWAMKTGSRLRVLLRVMTVCFRSFRSVLDARRSGLMKVSGNTVVYFPYPAVFSLIAWSILCGKARSQLICDAYISIFDSAVTDRGIIHTGWMAKALFKLEQRALSKADCVIVDTLKNEERISDLFNLPRQRFESMPIAIPEDRLRASTERISDSSRSGSDLVFFGAISPLHGIDVVLEAFSMLSVQAEPSLTIIGDGQSGYRVADYIDAHPDARMRWIRNWQPLESLAEIIGRSKIALGVFGGDGKASTVLPLKAYISLCLGKPFVTQSDYSLPRGTPDPPFVACRDTPVSLATAIESLLGDEHQLERLSKASREYFDEHLGSRARLARWQELIGRLRP